MSLVGKNPAVAAFVSKIENEFVFAQIFIRRVENKFELRHVENKNDLATSLRLLELNQLRQLAQFTASGAFRPLKSAPSLQTGWRINLANETELDFALNQLYPGAVADWFAAQKENPPLTNYREFTARQTGMYRITTKLDDAPAAPMIRACCHKSFCLKRRWWTVENLAPDSAAEKSLIPCLEPCAILLEFARKVTRLAQEEATQAPLSNSQIATVCAAAEAQWKSPDSTIRESDFDAANNPRRLRFLLEKYSATVKSTHTK